MISMDGIIFSLQQHGGISVYFQELIKRMASSGLEFELSLFDDSAVAKMKEYSPFIKKYKRDFLFIFFIYYFFPRPSKLLF